MSVQKESRDSSSHHRRHSDNAEATRNEGMHSGIVVRLEANSKQSRQHRNVVGDDIFKHVDHQDDDEERENASNANWSCSRSMEKKSRTRKNKNENGIHADELSGSMDNMTLKEKYTKGGTREYFVPDKRKVNNIDDAGVARSDAHDDQFKRRTGKKKTDGKNYNSNASDRSTQPKPGSDKTKQNAIRNADSRNPSRGADSWSSSRRANGRSVRRSTDRKNPSRSAGSRSPGSSVCSRSSSCSGYSRSSSCSGDSRGSKGCGAGNSTIRAADSRSPCKSADSRSPSSSGDSRSPSCSGDSMSRSRITSISDVEKSQKRARAMAVGSCANETAQRASKKHDSVKKRQKHIEAELESRNTNNASKQSKSSEKKVSSFSNNRNSRKNDDKYSMDLSKESGKKRKDRKQERKRPSSGETRIRKGASNSSKKKSNKQIENARNRNESTYQKSQDYSDRDEEGVYNDFDYRANLDPTSYASVSKGYPASNNISIGRSNYPDKHRSTDTLANDSSLKYVWQYEDTHGKWITYGKSISGFDIIQATTSDDIEKVYSKDPSQAIMRLHSKYHKYIMDFRTLSQTNEVTQRQRRVRRVPEHATNTSLVEKVKPFASSLVGSGKGITFEWQFKDEHGAWITYGQANSAGMSHCTTTVTSHDIEKYYNSSPKKVMMTIKSRTNDYVLDFTAMTQTNEKTSVQRCIRRIPIITRDNNSKNSFFSTGNSATSGPVFASSYDSTHGYGDGRSILGQGDGYKNASGVSYNDFRVGAGNILNTQNSAGGRGVGFNDYDVFNSRSGNSPYPTSFEWQFEDEHGSCITYGKPNSAGKVSHITTTCSDDIEQHYVSNPANLTPLTINSKNNAQYVLDFKNMTQTNQQTSVKRKIRRVPKASFLHATIPKGSTFVWSFKDEHGNWIEYGETGSSNKAAYATTSTSDDIETKFARNPTASLEIASGHHKYIIDFNAMTQTNINTKVVRAIRRQLVTPSDLPSNWTPMNASDKGLRVVGLIATDREYINQVAFVRKTLPSRHTITKIFRIQNEHLWNDFVGRKKALKKRNPEIKYKEIYLFHGTNPRHVQSICAENLDFRLNGTHGTKYGKGTNFATSAAYSANYAGRGATKLMFIVKVLIGHYTVGSTSLCRPPKDASGVSYDATVDNQANPTIYVKYDNTEYYPEYYIEFT